jgi:hypothetical protein
MSLQLVLQFATPVSVVVGFASLLNTLRVQKRQANAQVFLAYTGRYDDIMRSFPANALEARIGSTAEPPAATPEVRVAALRYLNLCSEEFHLFRCRCLEPAVWKMWKSELLRTLRTPLFRREWEALRGEFEAYAEFREFVDAAQRLTNERAIRARPQGS